MALMSKLTAAYVAGLLDGEGYLGIMTHKNKKYPERPYYRSVVKVCMTSKDMIMWLQAHFGGLVETRKFNNDNWKDAYGWRLDNKEVLVPFLSKVRPYLKIKWEQCDLLLRRLALQQDYNKRTDALNALERGEHGWIKPGQGFHSDENYKLVQGLYEKCKFLNRRGKDFGQDDRLSEERPLIGQATVSATGNKTSRSAD